MMAEQEDKIIHNLSMSILRLIISNPNFTLSDLKIILDKAIDWHDMRQALNLLHTIRKEAKEIKPLINSPSMLEMLNLTPIEAVTLLNKYEELLRMTDD